MEPDIGLCSDFSAIYPCTLGKIIVSEPQLRHENTTYKHRAILRSKPIMDIKLLFKLWIDDAVMITSRKIAIIITVT